MIDHYLWGDVNRISPEAPVPVVEVQRESSVLGGAGNVANNLYAMDCEVGVLSVVGQDSVSIELKDMLDNIEVASYLIYEESRKTSKKTRLIATHTQVVRFDKESKEDIHRSLADKIFNIFKQIVDGYDIVLLSDYGKGVLTNYLTQNIISLANSRGKKVLIDPKGTDYSKYRGAYLLTPNKKEAIEASGVDIRDDKTLIESLQKLQTIANLSISLITLSEDGIAIYDDKLTMRPTVAREVYDVTGAGDTVLASLGYALTQGKDIVEAIEFANLSAGVVVGKIGSATATLEEIEEYRASLHKTTIEHHIQSFEEITQEVQRLKKLGKKIVFTNGCFDILHRGHVSYLDIAKSFGDVLILGLNSDSSVRKLKGKSRPINTEEDRAFVLAGLQSVDFITIFSEDTPYNLIEMIEPDILVKGGDYEGKEVVGSDIAKEVKLVQFVDGKSTSKTIDRIQGSC